MKKLKVHLEHCYGIDKLNETFSFDQNNIVIIYAPNGTMKTSLANTFLDISLGKSPTDKVYGFQPICDITDENGSNIKKDWILVINPFNNSITDEQNKLMGDLVLV